MNRSKVVVVVASLALGAGLLPPAAASAWAPTETATNSSLRAVQLAPGTEPFKPNLVGAILDF